MRHRSISAHGILFAALFTIAGYAGGCTSSTVGTDLGIVEPGCRAPSACYKTGADCRCGRSDVEGGCKACDPNAVDCVCAVGTRCMQAAAVCVGRAPSTCDGVGARCMPVGTTCATPMSGAPPQLVAASSGAALEPHCTFLDDVCCPGVITDLGVAD